MNGTKDNGCLSDLLLDRYLVEELESDERARLEGHVAACEACRDLLARRRAEAEAWRESAEIPARARLLAARARLDPDADRPRPWWRRRITVWGPGLALAATAALLLVVLLPRETHVVRHGLRLKGGFALGAYLKRGEAVSPVRSGETLRPGDRLRFTYSADRGGHLCLVGLDARDVVTLYYPTAAGPAPRVEPASGRALPEATVLDETLGRETVVGLLCPRPFSADGVRERARRLIAAVRRGAALAPPLLPQRGCRVARFELRKAR